MKYLISLCLLLCALPLWAQDNAAPVVISGPLIATSSNIASVYWTPDSQGLIFEEKSIFPDEAETQWYVASITPERIWKVTPTTSAHAQSQMLAEAMAQTSQKTAFEFERGVSYKGEGVVVASPNPNYFVYVGEFQVMAEGLSEGNGPIMGYPLVLVDVAQNRSIIVPEVIISDLEDANVTYQINWSADGTALTVATQSNFGAENLYYVSSYSQDLGSIKTQQLELLEIDGILHGISPRFGSLSRDGKRVLLSVVTQTPDGSRRSGLFLWDVETLSNSRVLVQDLPITMAAFDATEENVLFIIYKEGFRSLNLQSGSLTPITISLEGLTIGSAWLSPDRQRFAVIAYQDSVVSLLIVDLS